MSPQQPSTGFSTVPSSKTVAFTLTQLDRLLEWSDERPCGLRVNVVADHEEIEEVAEMFRRDPRSPLYLLKAQETGAVEVDNLDDLPALAPDLEAALALVERLERA